MRQLLASTDLRAKAPMAPAPSRPAAAAAQRSAAECRFSRQAVLARAVAESVIPRLLAAGRPQTPSAGAALTGGAPATDRPTPDGHRADTLVDLLLHGTAADCLAYVDGLSRAGWATSRILLDLLTPAARRLGVMWEEDSCDFAQVTLGTLRLRDALQHLDRQAAPATLPDLPHNTILLAQVPGEQHGLGLAMLAHFFGQAGWRVHHEPAATDASLAALVAGRWFDVVGLSIACDERVEALAGAVSGVRAASRNRAMAVLVGGHPFVAHPQLAAMVGADATAADAQAAVAQADALVRRRTARA